MALERHFHLGAVQTHRFHDVLGPGVAVTNLRTAQRIQVVERAATVLGDPKGLELGKPHVHLGGGLGAGSQLELDGDAIYHKLGAGLRNLEAGRDVRGCSQGLTVADAHGKGALRAFLQVSAVLVRRATTHGPAGVGVLRHGMLLEVLRHDDGHLVAGQLLFQAHGRLGRFLFAHNALDAAVMVDVRVADDDRLHGTLAQMFLNQGHRRPGALHAHERVDDNPARLALNKRKVRHVVSAHLVDAVNDFEQTVHVVVPGVLPQAGVRRGGGIGPLHERVGLLTPDDTARVVAYLECVGGGYEIARRVLIFGAILKIELIVPCDICCLGKA